MRSKELKVSQLSDYYVYAPSALAKKIYLYPLSTGFFKSATTSSTGGLILALKRALLLLAPKGGVASTFTGPL